MMTLSNEMIVQRNNSLFARIVLPGSSKPNDQGQDARLTNDKD